MIQVLKDNKEYWSKADAFILPLTGLKREQPYEMQSFLFWNEYKIHDYKLILSFKYTDYTDFIDWCRKDVFPVLDKRGYVIENYDTEGRSVFVLDMSEWAGDIEEFIKSRYSKISNEGKEKIEDFHNVAEEEPGKTVKKVLVPIHIYAVLYPRMKMEILEGLTPIEYLIKYYEFDPDIMNHLGEVGSPYKRINETLFTELDSLCCQDDLIEQSE
jgi:hypothetical protein